MDILRFMGHERRESSIDRYIYGEYRRERANMDGADPSLCILIVVRTLLFNLRTSPLVTEMLGEGVRPKPFLFGGEPWVHGTVSIVVLQLTA